VVEIKPIRGRLEEPAWRRGECGPVPPTDAHVDGGGDGGAEPSLRDRPIDLIDIARALGESSNIERLGGAAVRAWRDDLTLIRESLSYARTILAADAAILSQSRSEGTTGRRDAVDQLPGGLPSSPSEDQWSVRDLEDLEDLEVAFAEGLFARTDQLLWAHQEMARVDLSSAAATAGALELVEEQLAILTERHAAVDARLQQIRAVIIRRYRQAAAPARDRPA
jgi:hypothetical protein